MKEANIISFKVFIDSKGNLMTEYSKLPIEKITEVFNYADTPLIQKVVKELEPKLQHLHNQLEEELAALV
jgi:hypothetical protein|tara:strand:+ start:267 stop:476 length:210 start_codon:yes stop_codon:yes gene_type:complete